MLLEIGARYLEEEKVGVAGEGEEEQEDEETNNASISGGRRVKQLVCAEVSDFVDNTTMRRFLSFSVSEKVAILMGFEVDDLLV